MINLWTSIPWFMTATIVTAIVDIFTSFTVKIQIVAVPRIEEDNEGEDDSKNREALEKAFANAKTRPRQVFLSLFFFTICAWSYLLSLGADAINQTALRLGSFWFLLSLLLDFVTWLFLRKTAKLNFRKAYLEDQPWQALNYLAIFFSSFLGYGIIPVSMQFL